MKFSDGMINETVNHLINGEDYRNAVVQDITATFPCADAEELQQMYSQLRHKEPDEAMLRLQEKVMQELAIQKGEYNG